MWELDHKEGWALKNWTFELWCWRRLLRVPWTERRSNQSNLKEINSEYLLEELMLKLKLQYFGHLDGKNWLIGKDSDAGKSESQSEVTQSCLTLCDPTDWLWPTRLLHPWDFAGKNTGVGCYFLLQESFPTQGLNPGLPHCRQTVYHLSHQGSRCWERWKAKEGDSRG